MANALIIASKVQATIDLLAKRDKPRYKKVIKCLGFLEIDPAYPSLATHRYESLNKVFGQSIWESYVEAGTPSAWRIWWFYGPEDGTITVVDLGRHPE
jgi:hypothetical protein